MNSIITIAKNNKQKLEKYFFFDFKKDNKDNNLKLSLNINSIFSIFIIIFF